MNGFTQSAFLLLLIKVRMKRKFGAHNMKI